VETISKCDLWSLGVVCFELLCGQKPFAASNLMNLMNQISLAKYDFRAPGWKGKSRAAKDFCSRLLKHDPEKRPTAQEALNHSWMVKHKKKDKASSKRSSTASLAKSLADFQTYAKVPVVEKAVALLVAHKAFPKDIMELREQFEQLDVDGSGAISLMEFKSVLSELSDDADALKNLFDGLDAYHDNEISYTEFLAASLVAHGFLTEERIMQAFDDLDEDENGYISSDDLESIFGRDYDALVGNDGDGFIDALSQNGRITRDELLVYIRRNEDKLAEAAMPSDREA